MRVGAHICVVFILILAPTLRDDVGAIYNTLDIEIRGLVYIEILTLYD